MWTSRTSTVSEPFLARPSRDDRPQFSGQAIPVSDERRLFELLGEVKLLAREYRELTGRPLGVTGEVA